MYVHNLFLHFLTKYFFILNAASQGWIVSYIGGNKFEFYNKIENDLPNPGLFIKNFLII